MDSVWPKPSRIVCPHAFATVSITTANGKTWVIKATKKYGYEEWQSFHVAEKQLGASLDPDSVKGEGSRLNPVLVYNELRPEETTTETTATTGTKPSKPSEGTKSSSSTKPSTPKDVTGTGESINISAIVGLAAIASAAVLILIAKRREE